jgi:ribonuclease P protein subunit POP4
MALTPETLPRHELTGLHARVVAASNPDLVGVAGRVVRETTRTLHLASSATSGASRVRQVPKAGSRLEFRLPRAGESPARTDEAAGDREAPGTASERSRETAGRSGGSGGCEGVAYVTVDGDRLVARPALRTENAGDNEWR